MSDANLDPRRGRSASARLSWARDGDGWPNHAASRFVAAGGLTWHVQVVGQGPVLLLVHGTGASTHSWRDMVQPLAERFTVVAPDLPGHAFTPQAGRMSLPGMAAGLADLLRVLDVRPRLAVGHSAGAAILVEMALDGALAPAGIISLNGALLPIGGIAGRIFSPMAKVFATSSVMPQLFARWASDRRVVEGFIRQTGSRLDPAGLALYGRLARDPDHAAGALAMMANWDLHALLPRLSSLSAPLLLVVGSRDRSISPDDATRVRSLVPHARIVTLKGLGHLAHEEQPSQLVDLICGQAEQWHVLDQAAASP